MTGVILTVELFKYKIPFFDSLKVLFFSGVLYVILGSVLSSIFKFVLFVFFSPGNFEKYYSRMQYTIWVVVLTVWFFGLNINHTFYYHAFSLFIGTQICLVLNNYFTKKDFEKMVNNIVLSSDEEKTLIINNINLFYDHFLKSFSRDANDADEALLNYFNSFCDLIFETNPIEKISKLSVSDAMHIHIGFQLVCDFIREHKSLVEDDRLYYSKDIKDENIDAYIVSQRWYLLWRTEGFVRKWKIEPVLDPYVPNILIC